jgi:hypothetical protein
MKINQINPNFNFKQIIWLYTARIREEKKEGQSAKKKMFI